MVVQRADEGIAVAILGSCDGRLGLDDGVDAADWTELARTMGQEQTEERRRTSMGDLGGNLEEEVVLDIASRRGPFIGGHGEGR